MSSSLTDEKPLGWWNNFHVLVTIVLVLGGFVTLVSWAELNVGTPATPTTDSPIGPIALLRHHFAPGSTLANLYNTFQPANTAPEDASSGEPYLDRSEDVTISSNDVSSAATGIVSMRLGSNISYAGIDTASAVGMMGMDSLESAYGGFGMMGLSGTVPTLNITQQSTAANSSGSDSSSSSSSSTCSCLKVDPEQLKKQCSVKGWDWPDKNEELVTRCFDFLAHNTSQYLQLHQHNPSNGTGCTQQLLMHTFWSGDMTWKLKAVIQSFLFTHSTNDTSCRPRPVLNVWLQTANPTRDQLQKWAEQWDAPYFLCSDQIQFRSWSNDEWLSWLPEAMLKKVVKSAVNMTALQSAVSASASSGSRVSYSDAVRFLVLYKYGGIYTDGDVLLLRNMEPLGHFDFVYEWSFVKQGMNTAVFGARQQSPFALAVIEAALGKAIAVGDAGNVTFDPRLFNGNFHPLTVLRRVPPKIAEPVQPLPSILFDPVWLTLDTPVKSTHNITQIHKVRDWRDFFTKPPAHLTPPKVATDIFKGAFTHHWHNNWHMPFEKTSLIGRLVGEFDAFLAGKQPNAAGAMAPACYATLQPRPA